MPRNIVEPPIRVQNRPRIRGPLPPLLHRIGGAGAVAARTLTDGLGERGDRPENPTSREPMAGSRALSPSEGDARLWKIESNVYTNRALGKIPSDDRVYRIFASGMHGERGVAATCGGEPWAADRRGGRPEMFTPDTMAQEGRPGSPHESIRRLCSNGKHPSRFRDRIPGARYRPGLEGGTARALSRCPTENRVESWRRTPPSLSVRRRAASAHARPDAVHGSLLSDVGNTGQGQEP
jgi:hypothetical protein